MNKKVKIIIATLAGIFITHEAQCAGELMGLLSKTLRSSYRGVVAPTFSARYYYGSPAFSLSEQVLAPRIGARHFSSSSKVSSLLENPDIETALRKINGNCLKEIGARGTDDFVSKSHRVISLLKKSLERGASIDGQGGLADAEADWFAAWERQPEGIQTSLKNPHDAIKSLIIIADKHFYGIEPGS